MHCSEFHDGSQFVYFLFSILIGFALSLVYSEDVKHIRIQVSALEGLYYLADVKFFFSIPELVAFYSRNSLVGSFPGLDTVLKYPFRPT